MGTRELISGGSSFEKTIAYSRAVVCDDWIFVSGTTGYQYDTGSIADDIASQTHQTFVNIEAALQRAGSSTKDIVRVRYIVPNASDFPKCWPVIRQWLGDVQPAATMIEAGLMEKAMLIEIEVTACKGKIDGGKSAPPM